MSSVRLFNAANSTNISLPFFLPYQHCSLPKQPMFFQGDLVLYVHDVLSIIEKNELCLV